MSEESILILNMLREGKVTADQADALLRAVRETAPPPAPPPAPVADPAALAQMQNKLGELQAKLGDLQGKLGAAQAAKAAGQAAALAGKVLDWVPKPEIDYSKINKTVEEAMRGLHSLKNDAIRTAKVAGRQAAQEAKRATSSGRKSMKFSFNMGDEGTEAARPVNTEALPTASETTDSDIPWSHAATHALANEFGGISVVGIDSKDMSSFATITKTAWAATEAEARVILQQIFLTHQVENGVCRVQIVAPADSRDKITVDYEIKLPNNLPLKIETTHGEIAAEGVSAILTTETRSGKTTVRSSGLEKSGAAHLTSRSGTISISGWNAPQGTVSVETSSGDIEGENVTSRTLALLSKSGDITVGKVQTLGEASFEAVSGDVSVTGGSAGTRAAVKTQSGDVTLRDLRAEQISVDTVSGNAELNALNGTLSVKTVSGTVRAEAMHSQSVSLGTVSGDADWKFAAPFSGSLAGTTVSGDLTVALWPNSETRVEMTTTSGDLNCTLPLSEQEAQRARHLAGTFNAGLGSLKLQSVSGDLRVAGDEGKATASRKKKTPPQPSSS